MNLSEILARIHRRSPIFIYKKNATLLEAYVEGFLLASYDCKRPGCIPDGKAWSDFHTFLNNHPQATPGPSIAVKLMQIAGTDEAAYILFFELFNNFVRTHDSKITPPGDIVIE